MRRLRFCSLSIIAVGASLAVVIVAPASIPQASRYNVIPERNLFGLKTPEKEVALPPPPVNAPPVYLTGITTMLGYKQALLRVRSPASSGQPAREESLILTEGQREANVEVLRIDEQAGQVTILNAGNRMTLDFDRNGVLARSSAPALPNVVTNLSGSGQIPMRILPGRMPRVGMTGLTNAGMAQIPTPTGYGQQALYAQSTNAFPSQVQSGSFVIAPTNTTYLPAQPAPVLPPLPDAANNLTPQERLVLSELERAALLEAQSVQDANNRNAGSAPAFQNDNTSPGPVRPAIPPFPPVSNY